MTKIHTNLELRYKLALFISNELAGNNDDPTHILEPEVLSLIIQMVEENSFIFVDSHSIPISTISYINFDLVEMGILTIHTIYNETFTASGFDAYRIMMECAPHNMEGRRLVWMKYAWSFHNCIAHPLMQILSWFGFYKLAMWIHDSTQPIPRALKKDLTTY